MRPPTCARELTPCVRMRARSRDHDRCIPSVDIAMLRANTYPSGYRFNRAARGVNALHTLRSGPGAAARAIGWRPAWPETSVPKSFKLKGFARSSGAGAVVRAVDYIRQSIAGEDNLGSTFLSPPSYLSDSGYRLDPTERRRRRPPSHLNRLWAPTSWRHSRRGGVTATRFFMNIRVKDHCSVIVSVAPGPDSASGREEPARTHTR